MMDILDKLHCNMMRMKILSATVSTFITIFTRDRPEGYDLLHLVIEGAKWTIGISILIAALRMVIGVFFGVVLGTYIKEDFQN